MVTQFVDNHPWNRKLEAFSIQDSFYKIPLKEWVRIHDIGVRHD